MPGFMIPHRPVIPPTYHGSTPTTDPRIPGVTPHGDDSQSASSAPQPKLLIGAMVVIVALTALIAWLVFRPSGDETAARDSAAALGITVSDDWAVSTIDGGFNIRLVLDSDGNTLDSGYVFHIAETTSVTAPADASTWTPKIAGATAYAEGDPPARLLIDAGQHSWIVTPRTWTIYQDDAEARLAWYQVASAVSFTSGT